MAMGSGRVVARRASWGVRGLPRGSLSIYLSIYLSSHSSDLPSREATLPIIIRPSSLTLRPGRGAWENLRTAAEGGGCQMNVVAQGAGKGSNPAVDGDAGGRGVVTWFQKLGLASGASVELLAALSYHSRLSRRARPGLLGPVEGECPGGSGNAARPGVSSFSSSS